MSDPSDGSNLPAIATEGGMNPAQYQSTEAKVRFAIAHAYGMGKDGEPKTREWIGEQLGVSERQVSRYLNDHKIAQEVKEVLALTNAEWRLDMAVSLRKEIKRLEEIEQELRKKKKAVPTSHETKTVYGTPTGDHNVRLSNDPMEYALEISVPTSYEEITDYGKDLKSVQEEKRQHWNLLSDLLGLDSPTQREVDHTLSERTEEVKVIEFRSDDDDYPPTEAIDVESQDVVDVDNVAETKQHPDDATDLSELADDDPGVDDDD